jgi:hypothetical protein
MKIQYIEVKTIKKAFLKEMALFDDLDILQINITNNLTHFTWITQNLELPLNLKFLHIRIRIDSPLPDFMRDTIFKHKLPFGCVLYVVTNLYIYSADNVVQDKCYGEDIISLKPDYRDCVTKIAFMNWWDISNVDDFNTLKDRHMFLSNLIH